MQIISFDTTGKKDKTTVNSKIFAAKPNMQLLAQAVRVYLANSHQGKSVAKTRSEVARTKKKWFKQKGTGNARHGARTSNIFVGGGAAHGPKLAQHLTLKLTKVLKKKALISALSLRVKDVILAENLAKLTGKTQAGSKALEKIKLIDQKILVILSQDNESVARALRNLAKVTLVEASKVNALDILNTKNIIFTKKSLAELELRLLGETKAK